MLRFAERGGVIQSRVGRRILTTFVLAVLLPLLLVAGGALVQVSAELEDEGLRRVQTMSKSLGMDVFARLRYVSDQLRVLAVQPDAPLNRNVRLLDPGGHWLGGRVDTLLLVDADGRVSDFHERPVTIPAAVAAELGASPRADKAQLFLESGQVFIFQPVDDGGPDRRLVGARFDMEQLWSAVGIVELAEDVCVLDEDRVPVYCNHRGGRRWLERATGMAATREGPLVIPHEDGEERLTASWRLFLEPHFQVRGIYLVVGQKRARALASVARFQLVFPMAVALVLAVAVMLSIRLIRANLGPLEKLMEVTRHLRKGDFDARLSLTTGDEFEELGEAFNVMASDLGDQFEQMRNLADMDHALQQSRSVRSAMNVARSAIAKVCPTQRVAFACLDRRRDGSRLWLLPFASASERGWQEVEMVRRMPRLPETETEADAHELTARFPFMRALGDPGSSRVQMIPVRRDQQVLGAILTGVGGTLRETRMRYLRQVADILAVSLHNQILTKRLYYQANHDPLTGLPNRMRVKQVFRRKLEGVVEVGATLALVMIDLDGFKSINDTLGHAVGDILLGQFAQRLLDCVRDEDLVSRFSGDEFVLLLECPDPGSAVPLVGELAERIDSALRAPFVLNNREIHISASKGAAIHPDAGRSLEDLLQAADAAMYQAKAQQVGGMRFYTQSLRSEMEVRMDLEEALKQALPRGELEVHYQPVFDAASGRIYGAEALSRWNRGRDDAVGPGTFIMVAEEIGLIVDIGYWVLRRACEDMVGWLQRGAGLGVVSVNVSPKQLRQADFADRVQDILRETGLRTDHLVLEITETALLDERDTNSTQLERLRSSGIKVLVDDFGTGYASLQYVKKLPVDGLKIDRLFVEGLPGDVRDRAIVRAVHSLGEELGLRLVAEGVETEQQLAYLQKAGIHLIQGYYYSPPLPRTTFEQRFLGDLPSAAEVARLPTQG